MLIMTLAHARASGDGHLISLHVRTDVILCRVDIDPQYLSVRPAESVGQLSCQ